MGLPPMVKNNAVGGATPGAIIRLGISKLSVCNQKRSRRSLEGPLTGLATAAAAQYGGSYGKVDLACVLCGPSRRKLTQDSPKTKTQFGIQSNNTRCASFASHDDCP